MTDGRTISVCPILKSHSSAKRAVPGRRYQARLRLGQKVSFRLTPIVRMSAHVDRHVVDSNPIY